MVLVFMVALGVRLLYYTQSAAELYGVDQERYRIAHFYHEAAASLAEGNDRVLVPRGARPGITLPAGYPPGYFGFMAVIYRLFGGDMEAVLLTQCVVDAVAAVLVLLLGEALFSTSVGFIAALLLALSPQFAYFSLVIKPDTLTVVPVGLALILTVRGVQRGGVGRFVAAGLCLGVACWLRQNALLLAPALAVAVVGLFGWRAHWRGAVLMVTACAAIVAPVTLRNAAVYGELVPVTFGSGFALLSGLARDDYAGKFNLPRFAYNVSVEEAEARGLPPEYYFAEYERFQVREHRKFDVKHTVLSVFAVDGIARDRERGRRARALIAADPAYFFSIYGLRIARLMDYSRQLRSVSLSAGPRMHAYETLAFYAPLGDLGSYYAREGRWYDHLRPPLAHFQERVFSTWLLLSAAAVGLTITALAARALSSDSTLVLPWVAIAHVG
jgi:hypothetical protein